MNTDTVKTQKSLDKVIDYSWENEMKHFQEIYEVETQSQDALEPWIKWCEDNSNREGDVSMYQPVNHIFYHLMVVKAAYQS